jgi:hypothetical protein
MSFSFLPLLLVEEDLPDRARAALREAYSAPAEERRTYLEQAARALCMESQLDCAEARELVGL